MSGIIDQRTLDLLRARDPQTLAQAVDAHHAALLGVCYGLGWQGSQAEDLVQDTWLTFLKSLDSFEGRSSLKTYLIGILYHKSMEQRRFTQREQVADPIDEIFEERFGFWGLWRTLPRGPEEESQGRENGRLIEACLGGLSPDQRLAFYLQEVEHESTEFICNVLTVTVPHLGVLLFRARNKFGNVSKGNGMNPLNCKEVSALQAQGDLTPLSRWDRWMVSFHRAICFVCRKYERQLRAIGSGFKKHIDDQTHSEQALAFKKRLLYDLLKP